MKKKIVLSIAALTVAGLITGCGSSGDSSNNSASSNTSSTSTQKSVKAVDAYILGANVCDANGVCATTENNGTATANFANTTLTATGGYIDVNANNQVDDNDIKLPDDFTLKTPAGKSVISPITDLIANGANPTKLAQALGVNEADLYTDPIATNNITLAKAIQIVYALKAENKEKALVEKINNFVAQNSSVQTDLPPMDEEIKQPATQPKEENKTEAKTDLPPIKVATDLPPMDEPVATSSTQNNTTTSNTSVSAAGNLEVFANLASSVASDEAKTLIAQVVNTNVSNPIELEQKIANLKKELIKEAAETVENNAQNAENNATEAENAAQNAENNATEASENAVQNTENNVTEAENTQSVESNATENSETNVENNEEDTTANQENQVTPPSVPTDLPPM